MSRAAALTLASVLALSIAPVQAADVRAGEHSRFSQLRRYVQDWLASCDPQTKACWITGGNTQAGDRFFYAERVTVEQPALGAAPVVTVFLGNTEPCQMAGRVEMAFSTGEKLGFDGSAWQNTCNTLHTGDAAANAAMIDAMRSARRMTVTVTYPAESTLPAQSALISLRGVQAGLAWIASRQPGL